MTKNSIDIEAAAGVAYELGVALHLGQHQCRTAFSVQPPNRSAPPTAFAEAFAHFLTEDSPVPFALRASALRSEVAHILVQLDDITQFARSAVGAQSLHSLMGLIVNHTQGSLRNEAAYALKTAQDRRQEAGMANADQRRQLIKALTENLNPATIVAHATERLAPLQALVDTLMTEPPVAPRLTP